MSGSTITWSHGGCGTAAGYSEQSACISQMDVGLEGGSDSVKTVSRTRVTVVTDNVARLDYSNEATD